MFDMGHLADELETLADDPQSTLWGVLRTIVNEFSEAEDRYANVAGSERFKERNKKLAWACHLAADAIADASTFVDPPDKPTSEIQCPHCGEQSPKCRCA